MNNYFGIGLDAKIALDFHTRREEHPEKFRLAIARSFNLAGLSTHDKFVLNLERWWLILFSVYLPSFCLIYFSVVGTER